MCRTTPEAHAFIEAAKQRFEAAPPGILLGRGVREAAKEGVARLEKFGAKLLCGGDVAEGPAYRFQNTLLTVTGGRFLEHPHELQAEVFGPSSLVVVSTGTEQTAAILRHVEGSLTGTIYFNSEDAEDYTALEPILWRRVGRLIGNRMPTGVAVSPAMNHGGPYPATGHPGFTGVGLPVSAQRFAALHCYENLPVEKLPPTLR